MVFPRIFRSSNPTLYTSMRTSWQQKVFMILIFLYVLLTSQTWWTNHMKPQAIAVVMNLVLGLSVLTVGKSIRITSRIAYPLFALMCLSLWYTFIRTPGYGGYIFLTLFPALYLYAMRRDMQNETLRFCTKWFAIFVIISLFIYVVTFFISLPPLGIVKFRSNNTYPPFLNYFFYLRPMHLPFIRFQGFFWEPGHLAISSIFFMAANKFEFKGNKYMWFLLAGLVASLSLAGYVLFGITWLLLRSKGLKKLIVTAGAALVLIIGAQTYNGGDNILNNLIISRLAFDEKKGIEGNNRTNDRTDKIYNQVVTSQYILTGHPDAVQLDVFGAGYKKYIVDFGLVAALLFFWFYWSLCVPGCNRKYAIRMWVLVVITWCDCEYLEWFSWLLPYILGIASTAPQNFHLPATLTPALPSPNSNSRTNS